MFVMAVGLGYVQPANWTDVPTRERSLPERSKELSKLRAKKQLGQGNAGDSNRGVD